MINLFDNVGLTGNQNLKPLEKLNEILDVLTFPAETEEEQKLSESTFSCFSATLKQWVKDRCLYPKTITTLIDLFGIPVSNRDPRYLSGAWWPWWPDRENSENKWDNKLFNELIFLLIQYLLYKESMYKNKKSSQEADYQVLNIERSSLKSNINNVQRHLGKGEKLLPFFYRGDKNIDSPLDILTTWAVYPSSAEKKNILYVVAKHHGNSLSDTKENGMESFIQSFSKLPLNEEVAAVISQKLLEMHPYVKLNDHQKIGPQFFYTPSLLCQYGNFIMERILNLNFIGSIFRNMANRIFQAFPQKCEDLSDEITEIIRESLCSPFLQFRVDVFSFYIYWLQENCLQEKLTLHKVITASFLDFLKKLHYITLPAFLLKGECLYRHLKTEDKKAFFKAADLWLDEKNFNKKKSTLTTEQLDRIHFLNEKVNDEDIPDIPGEAIFYTMENSSQIIPKHQVAQTHIINDYKRLYLPYLSGFFYKMNRKMKEENQASYFEYLKKERPSTIMSNVTGDWGHNERTRKANYFESLKA